MRYSYVQQAIIVSREDRRIYNNSVVSSLRSGPEPSQKTLAIYQEFADVHRLFKSTSMHLQ